jgi:hypothetical protein
LKTKWKEKLSSISLRNKFINFGHHEEAGKPDLNSMKLSTDYIKRIDQINPIKRINYKRTMEEGDSKSEVLSRIETYDGRFTERMHEIPSENNANYFN